MFFDDINGYSPPELFHLIRGEIRSINEGNFNFDDPIVPTHTEDGIPIRKLYVTNLPTKTTRTELLGVFAQYGFVKSCWIRMAEKAANKSWSPTYAFVTFINPADAHKALLAPSHETMLRGRSLRISPADSWHQPSEDSQGRVQWSTRNQQNRQTDASQNSDSSTAVEGTENSQQQTEQRGPDEEPKNENTSNTEEDSYNIMDILNRDCLTHVLTYVPLNDLIKSERVSKRWHDMVQEYLNGIRTYKTSWWEHNSVTLTTAVLRRILQRLTSLLRLHIDHSMIALNDRTAHTIGKFCPQLEELRVIGMYTRNWNPLIYGCKQLKVLSFISCNKLTDSSLVQLVKNESCIENLTVSNNTHVTGLFLTGSKPPKLNSLSFYNCYNLQGKVLLAALDTIPDLTTLKLDVCSGNTWKVIPTILSKLPKLEVLSLSEITSIEATIAPMDMEPFCESLGKLKDLKNLNFSSNIYITNVVLKKVAQSCPKLRSLNVSSCNSRKTLSYSGVTDEGINLICQNCRELRTLNISYLVGLTNTGLASVSSCVLLQSLSTRGNNSLTAAPFIKCLQSCHMLEEIDASGCDNVTVQIVEAAQRQLDLYPRKLIIHLAGTPAGQTKDDLPSHKLLSLILVEEYGKSHYRTDFIGQLCENSSEDSFDQYDPENDDFLGSDDDMYLEDHIFLNEDLDFEDDDDDDDEDYEAILGMVHRRDNSFGNSLFFI